MEHNSKSSFEQVGLIMLAYMRILCDGLEISLREFFDEDIFDDIEQEIK